MASSTSDFPTARCARDRTWSRSSTIRARSPRESPTSRLKDELYYNIQMQPGIQPLATVEHAGTAWPVAWTRTFGSGRVFHLLLGHRDFGPDKDDPVFATSIWDAWSSRA